MPISSGRRTRMRKSTSIDTSSAKAADGVLGVLTGDDLAADDRRADLRLDDPFQGRHADEGGRPSSACPGQGALCRQRGRGGDRRTLAQAKAAAELVDVDYNVLDAIVDTAKTQATARRSCTTKRPTTPSSNGRSATRTHRSGLRNAAHVTSLDLVNNRLIPNAMEPRAAVGDYDAGTESFTLYTTSQNPHVARLVLAAFIGIAPEHKLRVVAPDVGGGFGSKIFIYAEETVCVWAAKRSDARSSGPAERSESFLADAHGRDHVTHAELALDDGGKILGFRVKTIANLGAYMSTFSSSVPTYLYGTLLSGQYNIPAIYCEVDAVYTNTAPVDAYRGAGRPEATYVVERMMETAARELASIRRSSGGATSSGVPARDPVIMAYDAGDYDASLDEACKLIDYDGFAPRKAASEANGKLPRHRLFQLYRGLRHRAVGGGRIARRRRRPLGIGRSAGQPDGKRRSADRLAFAMARAMRRPSRSWCRKSSASRSTRSTSSMATPTRCSSAWAHTARAPVRSACRRSSRPATR